MELVRLKWKAILATWKSTSSAELENSIVFVFLVEKQKCQNHMKIRHRYQGTARPNNPIPSGATIHSNDRSL